MNKDCCWKRQISSSQFNFAIKMVSMNVNFVCIGKNKNALKEGQPVCTSQTYIYIFSFKFF